LSIDEIGRLIAAARTPVEAAVVEFLYATGVRVSELVAVRVENIDFTQEPCIAHVKKGKGGKDRTVLFGRSADAAVRKMLGQHPSESGFLFEDHAQTGNIAISHKAWFGRFYVAANRAIQRKVHLGTVSELPTREHARRGFDKILAVSPGYKPRPSRPYTDRAIRLMVSRMGVRAGVGQIYPHALRRACATHHDAGLYLGSINSAGRHAKLR
jgi:integrase